MTDEVVNDLFDAGTRRFDGTGLDGPYQWASLWTCIDQGEAFYQPLNGGNPISGDVDALKAVLFFFDRRHEDGTMDDIDLSLQRSSDNINWTTVSSSASSTEEKERVFHDDFAGNYYWRLRIFGWSVTADQTACGTNSMKVRFAWFYEDSDREAAKALDDIDTEN